MINANHKKDRYLRSFLWLQEWKKRQISGNKICTDNDYYQPGLPTGETAQAVAAISVIAEKYDQQQS